MFSKLLLLALTLPLLVDGTPTHCDRWKGNTQYRCAKDNYGADSIHIKNIVNSHISFRIGKWLSQCGHGGVNYSSSEKQLGPSESLDEFFSEAQGNACNELFIYACQQQGQNSDCINVLTPSVN